MKEIDMSNSFYYFFSTVPQVLGGVLALFGVFVVFKIQTIKSELLGFGKFVSMEIKGHTDRVISSLENDDVAKQINNAVDSGDIHEIKAIFHMINNHDYATYSNKYFELFEFLDDLKTETISWSTISVILIILCLLAFPFTNLIINCSIILYGSMFFTIILISICLIKLITILQKALKDSTISPYKLPEN